MVKLWVLSQKTAGKVRTRQHPASGGAKEKERIEMSYQYLLTLCLILASTKVLSLVTGRLQLPQVVGSLLAGLLLGPAVFGIIQPNDLLNQLAELGVIVIMFSAGMGTNIQDLKASGKSGFLVALCGVLVPLGLGTVLMYAFTGGELSSGGPRVLQGLFLGTVLTATSVSITVETLREIGKLTTKAGNTILAAALIDDVLGLVCLTIVTSMAGGDADIVMVLVKIVLFFVFAGVMAVATHKFYVWYDHRVKDRNLHRFPVSAFVLCLFMAWAAEEVFGVADIIGAFAAGLIIAASPKGSYIQSKFSPLSYLLLTPIFFANIGIKVTLPHLDGVVLLFTVLLVVAAILSKIIGCGLGAKICGFQGRQCLQIGCGMACRGEVALIVANKGAAMGLVSEELFGPIIIMVVCCAIFTPIMLKAAFKGEGVYDNMESSSLLDDYERSRRLDYVTASLLRRDKEMMKPKTDKKA